MPVPPPDEEMLARMPMSRDEYEALRPRGRLTLVKQKLLNMMARKTLHRGLRIWLYRQMGVNIGKDCVVELFCYLDDQFPELIFFEDHSGPSRHVIILCHDDVAAKSNMSDSCDSRFQSRHGFVAPVRLKSHSGIGDHSRCSRVDRYSGSEAFVESEEGLQSSLQHFKQTPHYDFFPSQHIPS